MCLEPGGVTDLVCGLPGGDGRLLSLSWNPPLSDQNADSVNDYLMEIQQYVQLEGTTSVSLMPLVPPIKNLLSKDIFSTSITEQVGECFCGGYMYMMAKHNLCMFYYCSW